MKHYLKILILVECIALVSVAAARPVSCAGSDKRSEPIIVDKHPTPYRPSLRYGNVLFVEDPGSSEFGPLLKPDSLWHATLTALLGTNNFDWYGATIAPGEDGPGLFIMQSYALVIWNTYDYWWPDTAALTATDQSNIGNYLQSGGKVWLIGQDLLWSGVPMSWMSDHFHLADANQDYLTGPIDSIHLHGLAEIDSISFLTVNDFQDNTFYPDELIPDSLAHAVLEDSDSSKVVGIFYPGSGDGMSSFWTMDGRNPDPYNDWLEMVHGMLNAFGVIGVSEMASESVVQGLRFCINPNPATNSITVSYNLSKNTDVKLQVFDKSGRHMVTLVHEHQHAGLHRITWNRRDDNGVQVPQGVYFISLRYGNSVFTKKVIVIR